MPKGLPASQLLSTRAVAAFSLDTSVIEAAGFRFNEGALRLLRAQLPPWMKLVLSSVVCREITARRVAHIVRAEQQIRAGFLDLLRHGGSELAGTPPPGLANVVEAARAAFERELEKFVSQFDGTELGLSGDGLTESMFHRYFEGLPPFGGGRDKKHEFPDAAALLSLEDYAAEHGIAVVLVSKDEGWAEYAATSSRLYCLTSVQALTDLFESNSDDARRLRHLVARQITLDAKTIARVRETIAKRVPAMTWILPTSRDYRYSLSGAVQDVHVQHIDKPTGEMRLWLAGSDRRHCVVQFPVEADVTVDVEMAVKDMYARNEPPELMYEQTLERVEFQVLMRITGDLDSADPGEWDIEMDVVDEVFEVEPSFVSSRMWRKVRKGFESPFDDPWDDIPF
jgi:hypothetical protein